MVPVVAEAAVGFRDLHVIIEPECVALCIFAFYQVFFMILTQTET